MRGCKALDIGPAVLIISLSLAVTIPASCSRRDEGTPLPARNTIRTARVVRRDFEEDVTGYGHLRPSRQAEVVAYTRGRLDKLWVRDGEEVRKGQRLFSIEGYFRIKEKEELGPPEGVGARGGTNRPIVKTSPMDGYVSLQKYAGQAVQAGEILTTITDLSKLIAEIQIFGPDAGKVRVDQPATITTSAARAEGKVAYIAPRTDPRSGGRKVGIEISQQVPWKFLPGDFVRVEVTVNRHLSSMAVPVGALLNDRGVPLVIVKNDQGFEKRPIRTGGRESGYVEVVKGLEENEEIVTEGAYEILHREIREKITPED